MEGPDPLWLTHLSPLEHVRYGTARFRLWQEHTFPAIPESGTPEVLQQLVLLYSLQDSCQEQPPLGCQEWVARWEVAVDPDGVQ